MTFSRVQFIPQTIFAGLLLSSLAIAISGCSVNAASGSGTSSSTSTPSTANEWTWMGGSSNTANATGVYGTQGVAASSNVPGGSSGGVSWTDSGGNFWLFGGGSNQGDLNALWEFNPTAKTWTWVSGSSASGAVGVYGTKGVAASSNVPGGRGGAVSWIDTSGNLWLFGGSGASVNTSDLNDLWEFNPTAKTWTWVSGSSTVDATGIYGTQNVPAVSNVPGGRYSSVSWIDSSNNLWLFGGQGYDSMGRFGTLNDLWEFNTTSKQWAWVSGSTTGNSAAVYGTQNVAAAPNVPGSRWGSNSWVDGSGNLWLFGGSSPSAVISDLNDLWEFNTTSKQWTWVSGSKTSGVPVVGVYGTQNVAAATNVPGSRCLAVSWIDSSGNLWLFGGQGYDSTGTVNGNLNDLWKFNLTSKQWAWVSGASALGVGKQGQAGVYGTLGGPAVTNVPGGKVSSVGWIDGSGNLWLFGGDSFDSTGMDGNLNDLWRYQP